MNHFSGLSSAIQFNLSLIQQQAVLQAACCSENNSRSCRVPFYPHAIIPELNFKINNFSHLADIQDIFQLFFDKKV